MRVYNSACPLIFFYYPWSNKQEKIFKQSKPGSEPHISALLPFVITVITRHTSELSFTLEATLILKLDFEIHKNSTKQTRFLQSKFISFPFRAGISVEPRWGPVFITGSMLGMHRLNSQLLIKIKKGNSASSVHIKKKCWWQFLMQQCVKMLLMLLFYKWSELNINLPFNGCCFLVLFKKF